MVMRIVALIVLAISLAFVFLAPQGLLTNPTLEEGWVDAHAIAVIGDTMLYVEGRALVDSLAHDPQPGSPFPGLLYLGLVEEGPERVVPVRVWTDTTEAGAHARILPGSDGLTVRFPHRGAYSYRFADWKVYDAISKELRRRAWPGLEVLEVHDRPAEEVRYLIVAPENADSLGWE